MIQYDEDTRGLAEKKLPANHSDLRSKDIPRLRAVCQLLREFEDGTVRLHHEELFGLATNLANVETGSRLFLDTFKRNAYADNRIGRYGYWVHQLKKYIIDYKPQSCNGFCPHRKDCHHGTNLLSTAKLKYHQMERVPGYVEHLCGLDEAADGYRRLFYGAVEDPRKIWHIIKAQTALGKTHAYLDFVRNTSLRVLIAVPTNNLKREVGNRAKEMGIEIIESPSLREIKDELPDGIWEHIEYLYSSGKPVTSYLKRAIRKKHPECIDLLERYLKELDEFREFGGHAITTHKRLLSMDVSKYDLVIIDEDILLGSIIQNKIDISVSELKRLKKETAPGSAVRNKVSKVLKYIKSKDKAGDFFELPAIDYDEADDGITIGVNIPSFCSASRFLYRRVSDKENRIDEDCVTFIQPVEFMPNTKYIMVSATVDETVCEYFFGRDNMEFYECKKARLTGAVYQDCRRSMSRADIRKDPTIFEQIKRWSGFKHTISFKDFMKYYSGDLHFGNSAGCDYMKGEDIDVIGTPHVPEWIYKLFAFAIGCDFDAEAAIKPGLTVEHNGWRFRFTTYEDKALRAIQFYIIESQLEQAVGRARLLREKCTVNLISNFPLCQAIIGELSYDNYADGSGTVESERKEL